MPSEMDDDLKAKIREMFKAKQKQEDAKHLAEYQEAVKNNTPFIELIRAEYDPVHGTTRHGIVYSNGVDQKAFFRGETPEEGFTPVLVPYRGK